MAIRRTCKYCEQEFDAKTAKSQHCCRLCLIRDIAKQHFPDGSDFAECKECGMRGRQLTKHIKACHNMSVDEYCEKHHCDKSALSSPNFHILRVELSKSLALAGKTGWQKGGKNPSHDAECKNGRRSKWSMNYSGYDGMSDEEKRKAISEFAQRSADKRQQNGNNSLTVEYYINKGYSIEDAKRLLKERQTTFSLKTCIEKYGKDEGQKIFDARQKKWQNTLQSKSPEELDRIRKARAESCRFLQSYSKISQRLFDAVYAKIKDKYQQVYYATLNSINGKSNEYEVILEDGVHRYLLDFYVKDNNKVIEFDGDYWHGKSKGNRQRDKMREDHLRRLGYVNILRIKEHDYKTNPDKVIQQCIDFIDKA